MGGLVRDLEEFMKLEKEIDRLDRLIEWKEREHWRIIERAGELIEQGAPYEVLKMKKRGC